MTNRADQTVWEVPIQGGGTKRGTERQLDGFFRGHDWRSVARQVQPTRSPARAIQEQLDQDGVYEDPHPGRSTTSVRTYAPVQTQQKVRVEDHSYVIPKHRASAYIHTNASVSTDEVDEPPRRKKHQSQGGKRAIWFYFVVGMLAMSALFVAGLWIWPHYHQWRNYSTYGYPPTWQCDAVVGHHDSPSNPSHFIFLNLHGHPEVIEIPGGDETKQKTYLLPQLVTDGYDTIPITGEFADVNGDGKPDLIVTIQGQNLVFINTGSAFRPLQPGEHVSLPANVQPCH